MIVREFRTLLAEMPPAAEMRHYGGEDCGYVPVAAPKLMELATGPGVHGSWWKPQYPEDVGGITKRMTAVVV